MVLENPDATEQAADGDLHEEQVQAEAVDDSTDLTPDTAQDGGADQPTVEPEPPETLEAFLARNPNARTEYDAYGTERENAGGNRREARLKNEAGKADVTKRNVSRFLTDIGVDPNEALTLDNGRQVAYAEYLYLLAQSNAAQELAGVIPDVVLRNHPVPVEVRERALEARESGDWDGYVGQLINGAVEAGLDARMVAYKKEQDAANTKWRAGELAAIRAEKAPVREGAPAMPRAVPAAPVPYWQLTPEQRAAMTSAERDAAVAASTGAR